MAIICKAVNNVPEYLNCLNKIWSDNGFDEKNTFMYRGHPDASYVLLPTLLRQQTMGLSEDEECHHAELEYPEEFDRHHHLSTLVKMRHFGARTRLLDFSRNPLISLYFACSDPSNKDKGGQVIVVKEENKHIKYHGSDTILAKCCLSFIRNADREAIFRYCQPNQSEILDNKKTTGIEKEAIHRLYHEIRSEYPTFEYEIAAEDLLKMHFVAANKDNERMKAQDGVFAFFGLDEKRCKKELEDKVVAKINIPNRMKISILKELEMLRINDSTVYPGVERTLLDAHKNILKIERKY